MTLFKYLFLIYHIPEYVTVLRQEVAKKAEMEELAESLHLEHVFPKVGILKNGPRVADPVRFSPELVPSLADFEIFLRDQDHILYVSFN